MNAAEAPPSPIAPPRKAPSINRTLRRLFLTLFLRGRSARGLQKEKTPKSIGRKLALTLGAYAILGGLVISMVRLPIFALSIYLHATTFALLGMFLASSVGEVLFNKEEADILLHRPIDPRKLLWAKIRVLLEASLWIAGAFNLAGFFVGLRAADGGWRFVIAHLVSVPMEALFCAGCVVMAYQLCLRWFGRERLDGLVTTAQVTISVGAVLASQLLPRILFQANAVFRMNERSWKLYLIPPAWFAGFDDVVAGSGELNSWLLAALALGVTLLVLWIAFAKLAQEYEAGVQRLSESVPANSGCRVGRRWIDVALDFPVLRWWLRDPVSRASFLLTISYLVRDRDVKLRVYPATAPILVLPIGFLVQEHGRAGQGIGGVGLGFGVIFAGAYLSVLPMMVLGLLQYSQQWQASDIFRAAPIVGPASLCAGARKAVIGLMALPALSIFAVIVVCVQRDASQLLLLLPGFIALPIFALVPSLGGRGVPLSLPPEEAKGANRGLVIFGSLMFSFVLAGIAFWAWIADWFHWFIIGEIIIAVGLNITAQAILARRPWRVSE